MFKISPNEEKQLKHDYEKLKTLNNKTIYTEEHATTCLFYPYVSPADTLHC